MEDFHPENEGSRSFKILVPVYQMTLSYPGSEFDSHHHDSLKSAPLIAELKLFHTDGQFENFVSG
jgi:hypothetical protein